MADLSTLALAAATALSTSIGAPEENAFQTDSPLASVSAKFAWKGGEYEVSVKKLPKKLFLV